MPVRAPVVLALIVATWDCVVSPYVRASRKQIQGYAHHSNIEVQDQVAQDADAMSGVHQEETNEDSSRFNKASAQREKCNADGSNGGCSRPCIQFSSSYCNRDKENNC